VTARVVPGRRSAGILVAGVLATLVTLLIGVGAPPARAADPVASDIVVVIDAMTPVVPTAAGTLRIQGRLINEANVPLTNVHVRLRRSPIPLTSRADVAEVVTSPLTPPAGSLDGLILYATQQNVADTLGPGERRPFTISIPFAQMGMTAAGTYVLGIEATGRQNGVDAVDVRKADLRTFLPWFPTPDSVTPVDLVWLWPLSDWPAVAPGGELLNNRTPSELSAGGRLDRLLNLGSRFRSSVSWIIDPVLVQTASNMARGYQVLRNNEPTLGDHDEAAASWLDQLREATAQSGARSMPYADVDVSAVVRAGMSNDVVRAVTQGPAIAAAAMRMPVPGGVYWAPFGRLDRASTNVLSSAGVSTVILSGAALPATDAATSTDGLATAALPTSVGTMRAVLTDSGLTELLSQPIRTPSDVVLARQQFLAETALVATSLPTEQTSRTLVVAPDSVRWDPSVALLTPLLRATRTAPWLGSTTFDQLLAAPVSSTSRQRGGYGAKAKAAELTPQYMARVKRTTDRLDTFTAILDDPSGISEPYSAALLRAESAAWRTSTATGEELINRTADELATDMAQVRVLSKGTITLSGDTGRVPVTIQNDLDRSVTVGLTLIGNPALRLSAETLGNIQIEAGRMASVDIEVRVIGGDPLDVQVQLLTPEGAAYGRPARIEVTSTAYSRAAAWVVAAAFLAIAVFVVVGVTRRIHKARATRSAENLER
jgi:hypothetical protein